MSDRYETKRRRLLEAVSRSVAETSGFIGCSELDPTVIAAMMSVPRHEFVPVGLRDEAYENRPLPIGHDQTISQPYIVAVMTEMACLTSRSRVLEIGTGCGYQTAVLASIAGHVASLERIAALADAARDRLHRLGYCKSEVFNADGGNGWPTQAPYDAIVVTAAAKSAPAKLVAQLRTGGRMIIPLGRPAMTQSLTVLEKGEDGSLHESCHLPVAFVPMIDGISVL